MQGGRAQITRICTITGNMGALKSATQIGGSGHDRFDGLGVTRGSLARSRLDEAPAFGWCPFFRQLANPHFTAILHGGLFQWPASEDAWRC